MFALGFSALIALGWELVAYGCDSLFGMDMQKDCYVESIHSYLLEEETGQIMTVDDIDRVVVNGHQFSQGGYLDIGLNDTMQDLLIETIGVVVMALLILFTDFPQAMVIVQEEKNVHGRKLHEFSA